MSPKRCINCGIVDMEHQHDQSRTRCNNCYKYLQRHHTERPPSVYNRHFATRVAGSKIRMSEFEHASEFAAHGVVQEMRERLQQATDDRNTPPILSA